MASGEPRARPGRAVPVKNKAPAPVQISAEQLLREAMERVEAEPKPTRRKITDEFELDEYRSGISTLSHVGLRCTCCVRAWLCILVFCFQNASVLVDNIGF